MLASQYPYRRFTYRPPRSPAADPLGVASTAARLFVVLWSLARDAACIERGFDFEGFLAATIIALTFLLRARSLLP